MNAFDRLLEHANIRNQATVARIAGVSPQAVSKWRGRVPDAAAVLKLAAATGWKVTPHDLRPDIYPNPTDGLPADDPRRSAVQVAA